MSKRKLCIEIINDQFGDQLVGKVAAHLIENGRQRLIDVIKKVKLNQKQAHDALAILIHHNICEFYTEEELLKVIKTQQELKELEEIKKDNKKEDEIDIYFYEINLEAVLMRYRVALFIQYAKNEFDTYGEIITESFADNGRLTMNDLIYQVIQKMNTKNQNEDFVGDTDEEKIKIYAEKTFKKMVKERYIQRVPKIDNSKLEFSHNFLESFSMRLTKQVVPKGKANISKTTKSTNSTPKNTKKRKVEEVLDEEDQDLKKKKVEETNFDDMSQILWRINYDQFSRKMRHDSIIDYTQHRLNKTAGLVIKKMIELSSVYEREKNDSVSASVKYQDAFSKMTEDEDISDNNFDRILESLVNANIINQMSNQNGGSFVISKLNSLILDLGFISEELKRKYAEAIIEQRFGVIGSRIFRLLLEKKQLEEKQVTHYSMIPASESRTVLFKMHRGGIVQLQEVPKSNDHHPTRTYYLWNVNLPKVYEKLNDDMYKTIRNLRMRLTHEREQVIAKIGGGEVSNVASTLSDEQTELLERFGKVEPRIEFSILHLMELLMFFEYFV